ncbi:MAG: hydratase [Alphaproteobacteria bacterium]|nr:hydratase [Alphaproteobacteria bacterium]
MANERAVAEAIWQAWRDDTRLSALPQAVRPGSLAEGYAAQRALAALAGSRCYGWKIAATSAEGQRHIGVDAPLAGRLFESFRLADGAGISVTGLTMRCAEPEFAFRLGHALPPRATSHGEAEVMAAVAGLYLAIEVPDSRFADFAAAGGAQLAADNACARYFVLGPEMADWSGRDLAAVAVTVEVNGRPVSQGSGANVLGDPRRALTWLANHLAGTEGGLKAGDIVTTGAAAKPVTIAAGDRVTAHFAGLGKVSVHFTP